VRLAEPINRGPISTSRALSTAIHRNQQWVLECLGTVAVIRHWCRQVPSGHASSPGGNYGFLRRGAPEPVPGRHTICSRGPWRRPRSPSHPFAISRVSRRQASQTPSRRRESEARAAPPRRTARSGPKIILRTGNPGDTWALNRQRRVECPPAPNPSPIRRLDPGPFGRGLPFWEGSKKQANTRRPLSSRQTARSVPRCRRD